MGSYGDGLDKRRFIMMNHFYLLHRFDIEYVYHAQIAAGYYGFVFFCPSHLLGTTVDPHVGKVIVRRGCS